MGAFKLIGGLIGWAASGPIGAVIGYLLGSLVESSLESSIKSGRDTSSKKSSSSYGGSQSRTYSSTYRTGGYTATEQRNSFMVSLLVLSAAVIKADGKTHPSELEAVKTFIRTNFGESAVPEATRIINELCTKQIDIYSVGGQIASCMNYSQRLQLMHYLAGIANADGDFCESEASVLEAIAAAIGLSSSDAASVIATYRHDTESAYTVLGISSSATDDEVKSAYRKMAM